MHSRSRWTFVLLGISIAVSACSEESWQTEETTHAVATVGCGNDVVEGYEECDGLSDNACPGACSLQCACPALPPQPNLEVHMMDIGQGDGLVVISPDGFVTLVDSGVEAQASTVSAYLASIGVTDIDYTVVSHLHSDHFGATDVLLQQFPNVVACFDNGGTYSSAQYTEYDTTAGSRRVAVGPGDTIDMGPSVQVDVLHGHTNASNENNNSVVFRITHNGQTFLLGGDCETECESSFDPGQIDVYKAHHHGSRTGSSDLLLSRMNATTAIMSLAAGNSYGHPHIEALERLAAHNVTVHRTDLEGPLVVLSNGVDHVVNGDLGCTDNDIRACGQSSVGVCQLGTQTCTANTWSTCVGDVGPVTEDCSNGLDDDCDGATDAADCDCGGCGGGGGGATGVLVSQVYYDTIGTDSAEEFIDLYNPGTSSVDLSGWTMADNASIWSIPSGTTIGAHSYLTIARNQAGFLALFGFDPDVTGMTLSLNNTGDVINLKDASATLVDHVAWENFEAGWGISSATGDAIERIDPSTDTDTVDDWSVTAPASPRGGPSVCGINADCDDGSFCNGAETCDPANGCLPGSDPCGGLACNEATDTCGCTLNAECDDGNYCNGVETCGVGGSCQAGTTITCDDGVSCTVDSCNEATDSCDFAANDNLCSNGLFCDGAEVCDPAFDCQAGAPVDCAASGDSCNTGVCNENQDACEAQPVADGTVCDNFDGCDTDTCQLGVCQPAVCTGGSSVMIIQVSYDTPGTDSVEEFIEIYNPTAASVDLSGWSLSDNVGTWSFPSGTSLASGRSMTIATDRRGFRRLYGYNPDIDTLSLSLNNTGDIAVLRDNTGTEIDMVAWEGYVAGWDIASGTGDSIERIDLVTDTDTVSDWAVRSPGWPFNL